MRRIVVPTDQPVCNPSIANDGDGFRVLLRSVNYRYRPNGHLAEMPIGGFQSGTWMARLDHSLTVTGVRLIDDSRFRAGRAARGFEDCSLFRWRGEWWFSATVLLTMSPVSTLMALCRLNGDTVVECRFMRSPVGKPFEKNWMPLVRDDDLLWIYRIAPMKVVREGNGEDPHYEHLNEGATKYFNWSGSSQCVRYEGRWLCVIHFRVILLGKLTYLHAFVELDDDLHVTRVSEPWIFEQPGIEFCAGLCLTEKSAILSYGVFDCECRIIEVPLNIVERMLRRDLASQLFILAHRTIGTILRLPSRQVTLAEEIQTGRSELVVLRTPTHALFSNHANFLPA